MSSSFAYFVATLSMFVVFIAIVVRTYSRKNRERNEEAKYHMLDDD